MDKTAFVTGASAGIGEATAHALLAAGYRRFVGAEYRPRGATEDGLGWLDALRRRA